MRVLVPLQLHAQAAHAGIFGQAVELRPHVVRQKVGIADNGLRKAGFVGSALHIGDFILEAILRPIALYVDRLRNAGAGEIGEIFVDQIVAADRFVRSEDARLHRSVEPRQIAAAPDVVVRVDNVGHAAFSLAMSRTLAQMPSIEEPSASRSR